MPYTSGLDTTIPLRAQQPDILGKLSTVIGIKQQQQALQQSKMQTATEAMVLGERQKVQAMMSSGKDDQGNSILDENGEPDVGKVIPAISRIAPTTGQQYIQAIQQTHANKLALQSQVTNLTGETREALSGIIRSKINDPNANSQDLIGALDTYGQQNPAAIPSIHYAEKLLPMIDKVNPGKKNEMLLHLAQEFQKPAETAAQQQPAVSTVNQGSQIGLLQTNPLAPGGVSGVGTMGVGVAPGVTTNAAGQLVRITPGGGSVNVIPAGGGGGGASGGVNANPTTADVTNVTTSAKNDEDLYSSVKAVADSAPQIKNILSNINTLAGETKTGKYSKEIADAEAFVGQRIPGFKSATDDATKRQLLGKYVSQLLLQAKQSTGSSTDQAQAEVKQAIPDPDHMTPDAIRGAVRLIQAQTQIAQARGAVAQQYKNAHGGSSVGLRAVDSQLMQNMDPRAFDYLSLGAKDRQKFMRDNFKTDAERKAFADKLTVIDHMGGFNYAR